MKEITETEFKQIICNDFNIDIEKTIIMRLPATKIGVKTFTAGVAHKCTISNGITEEPFLINGKRNTNAFLFGKEIRLKRLKTLSEILKECGLILKTNKIKKWEQDNCYGFGFGYYYKEYYCES